MEPDLAEEPVSPAIELLLRSLSRTAALLGSEVALFDDTGRCLFSSAPLGDVDARQFATRGTHLEEVFSWGARRFSLGVRPGRRAPRAQSPDGWRLTPREHQVLGMLLKGLPNKSIAAELGCATRTVELHVSRVLDKAGVSSRHELLARFVEGDAP